MTPPLRFLLAVIGGWACARGAVLAPWPHNREQPRLAAVPVEERVFPARAQAQAPTPAAVPAKPTEQAFAAPAIRTSKQHPLPFWPGRTPPAFGHELAPGVPQKAVQGPVTAVFQLPAYPPLQPEFAADNTPPRFGGSQHEPRLATPRSASRWSFSAWALARRGGDSPAFASAGSLGASQAGMRAGYRLLGPPAAAASITARVSSPARSLSGTEAALGIEWQPSRRLPLRIAAERRQAVGGAGRSAFALLAHGGVSDLPVAAGFRLDAYGQAGVVGARSRDLFADGAARLTLPLDGKKRLALGAGAWAAAQPGVSRVDVGPSATLRLPGASLSLDWRVRVAGNAGPASGPALTVATGF